MSRTTLAAVGLVVALAMTGCQRPNERFSEESTETQPVTEVAVEGGAGSITVEPGDGSGVHINRTFEYAGGDRPSRHDRLDGTVLHLDTDCGDDCGVSYVVTVPTAVKVTGSNGSGRVRLRGVTNVAFQVGSGEVTVAGATGEVSVETGSGKIEITDAGGAVTARTGSGAIRIHRASGLAVAETGSGEIDVRDIAGDWLALRTSSGSISIAMNKPQTVRAQTGSGEIRVTVPAGSPFEVRAATDSGDTRVGITSTPGAPHTLDLRTGSGNVTVSTAT